MPTNFWNRGLRSQTPCLVANLSASIGPFRRAQRVYLMNPEELPKHCKCLMQNQHTGKFELHPIHWNNLRDIRIEQVPGFIGDQCWWDRLEVMQELLTKIHEERIPLATDFSTSVN